MLARKLPALPLPGKLKMSPNRYFFRGGLGFKKVGKIRSAYIPSGQNGMSFAGWESGIMFLDGDLFR